jgi:predicted MFS family arabinose efflux permease
MIPSAEKPDADGVPGEAAPERRPGLYAWYVVVVLMLVYILSMIDRKFPYILVESIKADLHLSDTQIGLLTGVMFAAIYSTVAIPIAALSDRHSRKRIIGVAVLVWSALTAIGGFAQNFWHLAFSRAGVAVGESGATPAAHSIIADYFTPKYRARALGLYFVGAHVGALLGLVLGGWINDLANWRVAMFALGAPGIVLTLIVMFTVKEPPRRQQVGAQNETMDRMALWQAIKILFSKPVFVHLMMAAVLFMITSGALQAFTPAYIMRTYGMSSTQVGFSYGIVAGLAGAFGSLFGGYVGDRLRSLHPWKALAFVAAALAMGVPCLLLAYFTSNYYLFLFLFFIAQFGASTYGGPSFATLQGLVSPRMHAVASAIYLFALSGVGVAIGPVIAGMMSDLFKTQGVENPLRLALIIIVLPKLWSAGHYVAAALRLRKEDAQGLAASI